ncbi:MAG: thioredoxin domain-containing protein [Myxococcales bacterium]|nr:thioredoxin domain-containing protein [Myxococcales bacterium]
MLSFALLSLLGVAVAIELTRIHVFVHTDPSYHSVCAMSEGVNCETVAVSPYSVFAGLPISVWGLVGYLVMGGLAFWSLSKRRLHPTWPLGLLLVLSAFSVATSAVLAFISATRIDSFCLFCMGSYAINTGLFIVSLIAWRQTRAHAWSLVLSDVKGLVEQPVVFAALTLAGVVTLGALLTFIPSYWRTPGWTDLPKLASGTDESGHHWIGARNPRLTIVEFSDYECPHCRAAHKGMRLLAAKHPEQIRLVHRHLPLDMACHPGLHRPFHARACLFAEAAECAGVQGRFWEMNDALFSIQETVKTDDVDPVELAVRLGLNRSDFKRCLEDHATAERIAADVRESMQRRLTGTPSFLVGERLFMGRIPEAELEQLLVETP